MPPVFAQDSGHPRGNTTFRISARSGTRMFTNRIKLAQTDFCTAARIRKLKGPVP